MAEETKKEAPTAASTPAPDKTKELEATITKLQDKCDSLTKDLKAEGQKVENLERKLKAAKSAPTGDVVVLDGKSWAVKGTVKAKNALEEVKRGHIPEDVTLVIIDRLE